MQVTDMPKDRRKYIHQKIKKIYGSTLDSNTEEKDGQKFIIVKRPSKGMH
jgi:hypothetical protein